MSALEEKRRSTERRPWPNAVAFGFGRAALAGHPLDREWQQADMLAAERGVHQRRAPGAAARATGALGAARRRRCQGARARCGATGAPIDRRLVYSLGAADDWNGVLRPDSVVPSTLTASATPRRSRQAPFRTFGEYGYAIRRQLVGGVWQFDAKCVPQDQNEKPVDADEPNRGNDDQSQRVRHWTTPQVDAGPDA
jgi:hypothetical protein